MGLEFGYWDLGIQTTFMTSKYRVIDHTADMGIEVEAASIKELFKNAGEAFCDIICDQPIIGTKIEKKIKIQKKTIEELLQAFLTELLYLFDTERELYSEVVIKNIRVGALLAAPKLGARQGAPLLDAILRGEKIDPNRHKIKTGIKAVTFHQLKVEQRGGKWHARIIFDV